MFRPTCLGLSIVLLCCVQTALADSVTNKCTDGKQITYTDKPCEKLGLKDAGAINKDEVTIVPAVTYRQVPQNFPREQAPRNSTCPLRRRASKAAFPRGARERYFSLSF